MIHYKSRHQGYKLGCPRCPQTYHSPELLHVHFKHFHERDTPIVQSAGTAKRAHVMLRCEYCDVSILNPVLKRRHTDTNHSKMFINSLLLIPEYFPISLKIS